MKLRPAILSYANFLLEIKNDPVMREFAVKTQKKIERSAHIKWLRSHIDEMQIVEVDGERAGMFRVSEDKEVSINLHPNFRGMGLGNKVLKKCPKGVWAKIVNGNVPSMRIFLANGFEIKNYEANYYILEN
jgi:hypothetical protein